MGDKRKNTADGATKPAKGRPGLKSVTASCPVALEARPPAPSPVAVETLAAASEGGAMTLLESDVPKTELYCDECHYPLKPPVYQCSRMRHVACGDCVSGGGDDDEYECTSCTDLAASVGYVQSTYLDTLLSNTKVACPYKKYGCASSLAFSDTAAHAAACSFGPCLCAKCFFEGTPADLLRHLTEESGRHAWAAHKITYGKGHQYAIDAPKSYTVHLEFLVAEEDGGVFVLLVYGNEDTNFTGLACVRNNAGAGPVYSSSLAVEGPGLKVKLEKKVMKSCSDPVQYHKEVVRDYFIRVQPAMLHKGDETSQLHVRVCISKTQGLSA
ncbi:hypothetical protein VPH35_118631 [Triticum aestivum]|uniref:E3 ubiquitin-protein ligase SINA-like 10 n=1 Tax=Triticum aestivum TaxID=4565 RepID=UPI001D023081|nr:E3 ubiquitin-protein ligase SINA-like 10 [Triticum aestivum]